jgi:hypothetical protein
VVFSVLHDGGRRGTGPDRVAMRSIERGDHLEGVVVFWKRV